MSTITCEVGPQLAAQRNSQPRLAPRERQVVVLYVSGMTLDSVAQRLSISPHTAKEYLDRARGKYAEVGRPVPTKIDLFWEAIRDGLIGD